MHGDLGLHVLRHAAQEPKLAQDQRTERNGTVVVALDPRLILLLAIHNAALLYNHVNTFKACVAIAN